MIPGWELPQSARIGDVSYRIHADYRDILQIFSCLDDPELPEFLRWHIALALFYEEEIPQNHRQEAMVYLAAFLNGGRDDAPCPGPKLLDWQQDAQCIVAEVNKVAGQEIRALPFVHWWTFLAWFHAIGQGQLSTLIAIRDKLGRGRKLEPWELAFYRENKRTVELKKRYSTAQLAEQERLKRLLDG